MKRHNFTIIFLVLSIVICGYVSGFFITHDFISKQAFEEDHEIRMPVIMYHSILKDPSRQGKFVISPDQFSNDLKYLKSKGYESVVVKDLINYIEAGIPLPEKPVMITFDDGYYNNYLYAYPILKEENMKAVISLIGKYSDVYSDHEENNAYYSHITWIQAKEMADSGVIELQNHSYDLHTISNRKGAGKMYGETTAAYQQMLYDDIYKMHDILKSNTGYDATVFTYPFGNASKDSIEVIKKLGYKGTFSCQSGVQIITKDIDCLKSIKRNNRAYGKSSEDFFKNLIE